MKNLRLILLFIFTFFSFLVNSFSQVDLEEIKSKLPKLLGSSNVGTEFVIGFHPTWEGGSINNAVRIYVSSSVETEVRLTIPGLYPIPYLTKKTIPNDVIEFVLKPEEAQPYRRITGGSTGSLLPTQVWNGRGVIIESDDPIIVYSAIRYENDADGFLALPVNVLGKNYIISSYRNTAPNSNQSFTPYADIIGVLDNTNVSFKMGGNNNSKIRTLDDSLYKPFEVIRAVLNRGDFWLIASEGLQSDLGGSLVLADKPITVLSGTHCSFVPAGNDGCDILIEQELPTFTWGKKYYVSPIVDRKYSSIIRAFCKESPTKFYLDGVEQFTLYNNWGVENEAWIELRANPDSNKPAVFSSDKPINIVQYNTGMGEDGVPSAPFQMSLLPVSSFLSDFEFITPGIKSGFGFQNKYINLIYKTKNGQIPDNLLFGEVKKSGEVSWRKVKDISSSPGNKFIDPDYLGTDTTVYSKTIKIPFDGVYRLSCPTQKINANLYGFGNYDGFGGLIGGNFTDLERKDTIPPGPVIIKTQNSPNYISEKVVTHCYVEDIDNDGNGNLGIIIHNKAYSYNSKVNYDRFIPGETKRVDFAVSMIDSTKDALAVMTFGDRSGNDTTISIQFLAKEFVKGITVTKPTSANKYVQGNVVSVEWTSNFPEKVKLELYKSDKYVMTISDSAQNNGAFSFKISTIAGKGTDFRIKVSSVLEPNVNGFSENFEIIETSVKKTLTLIQPSLQTKIQRGKTLQIIWLESVPFPVNIDLFLSDKLIITIIKNFNDFLYNWEIPLDIALSEDYKIRISDANDSNLFVETPSINIQPDDAGKILTFVSPNATTKEKIGSVLPVIWDCNFTENVKIELLKNDILELEIASDISNNKLYYWEIPKTLKDSKLYSIRISEVGKPNVSFTSENFEIYDPVSVKEIELYIQNFKLSPNPASTVLNLEMLNGEKIQSISVFNILGKNQLTLENIDSKETKLDTSNLPNGKYILEIQTNKEKLTESFMIVR